MYGIIYPQFPFRGGAYETSKLSSEWQTANRGVGGRRDSGPPGRVRSRIGRGRVGLSQSPGLDSRRHGAVFAGRRGGPPGSPRGPRLHREDRAPGGEAPLGRGGCGAVGSGAPADEDHLHRLELQGSRRGKRCRAARRTGPVLQVPNRGRRTWAGNQAPGDVQRSRL